MMKEGSMTMWLGGQLRKWEFIPKAEMSLPMGMPAQVITVSSLHGNLQVANFQRCEHGFHQRQALVTLHLVLRLLLLTILQLYPLPSHLPSPSVTLPACSLEARPLCQPLYYTAVLFKVLDWKIKNVFSVYVCSLYIIYGKNIINLVLYSTV